MSEPLSGETPPMTREEALALVECKDLAWLPPSLGDLARLAAFLRSLPQPQSGEERGGAPEVSAEIGLRNVLMYAMRLKQKGVESEYLDHFIRFCTEAGVESSPFRGSPAVSAPSVQGPQIESLVEALKEALPFLASAIVFLDNHDPALHKQAVVAVGEGYRILHRAHAATDAARTALMAALRPAEPSEENRDG